MRTSYTALSLLAVATSTLAQTAGFDVMTSPAAGDPYKVGETIPILWTPGTTTGTVTITLIGGTSAAALAPIKVVVAGITSQTGAYSWTIPSDVGSWASYGFNLTSDADPNTFQYSNAFYITGGGSSSSVSSATPSATSVSTPVATSVEQTTTTSCTGVTSSATPTYMWETKSAVANSTIATSTFAASTSKATVSSVTNGTATGSSVPLVTASGAGKLVAGSLAMIGGIVFALFL